MKKRFLLIPILALATGLNAQLPGQNEADILELGYQVVAISPDKVEKLQETGGKEEVNYRLFSDASGELSKAVGIAFQAPELAPVTIQVW